MRNAEWWPKVVTFTDVTLRILGAVSFVAVTLIFLDGRDRDACQDKVNSAQQQRSINLDGDLTRERTASRRVDDALAAIVASILRPVQPTPEQGRAMFSELAVALASQAKARDAADEARRLNPPVPPAETSC